MGFRFTDYFIHRATVAILVHTYFRPVLCVNVDHGVVKHIDHDKGVVGGNHVDFGIVFDKDFAHIESAGRDLAESLPQTHAFGAIFNFNAIVNKFPVQRGKVAKMGFYEVIVGIVIF